MSTPSFTADEITELLTELGARLQARGLRASIYVVGGAAIALVLDRRRTTKDIDAMFDDECIRVEAGAMAVERGLPQRWLNDAARAFVPGGDASATTFEVPGLSVSVSSLEHLLAMKMAAFRPQDQSDLVILAQALRLTSAEQIAQVAERVYGEYLDMFAGPEELRLRTESLVARLRR